MTFCRWYFQKQFLECKQLNFDSNFTCLCDNRSALVQVMAWYLNQCWLSSLMPYFVITMPKWVSVPTFLCRTDWKLFQIPFIGLIYWTTWNHPYFTSHSQKLYFSYPNWLPRTLIHLLNCKVSNFHNFCNIGGLMQDCSISIANALAILQSCTWMT